MTPEALGNWTVFVVFGAVAAFAALGMTLTMSMYRAGLALMVSFLALAVLFFQLQAELLAVVQVMMNVAGMAVMILFMVMLMMDPGGSMMWDMARQMRMPGIGALKMGMPRRGARGDHANSSHDQMMVDMSMSTAQVPWAALVGIGTGALLVLLVIRPVWPTVVETPRGVGVEAVGELLLTKYMPAFEGAALLILAGMVTAVMLGRREAYDRERARRASPSVLSEDGAGAEGDYACPMHPEVRSSEPGICPKCGMRLERTENRKEATVMDRDTAQSKQRGEGAGYACPMHPEVRSERPGKCPKCGMALEPVSKK